MSMQKNLYVTIKATLNCNLACKYCYGRGNQSVHKEMDDDQIKKGLIFVCDYAKLIEITSVFLCWHGGEPFLIGAKRWEQLLDFATNLFVSNGIKVKHGTQTNAVLLTPDFFPLINKYLDGYVGVSLDVFSSFRTNSVGIDSSPKVVSNIDKALASGIKCGAINLITQHNIRHIKEIYYFYKSRRMNVRLSRVFPISADFDLNDTTIVSDEAFAEAMIQYFELWANDPQPAYNNDIVSLIGDLLLGRPSLCLREPNCSERYLALAPEGNIYPCAEFDVPESIIGNFLRQTPKEFKQSTSRKKIFQAAPIPKECKACKYYRTCYGGCLRERFMMHYPFKCKSNIIYWNHVVKWIELKGGYLYMLHGKNPKEITQTMTHMFTKLQLNK